MLPDKNTVVDEKVRETADYILVFLLIVMTAGVSLFGATIFRLVLFALSIIVLLIKRKPIVLRGGAYILLIYGLWLVLFFYYFNIHPTQSDQFITYLSFTTLLVSSYTVLYALDRFVKIYVKIIYYLSIISFIFYFVQLTNFDILLKIVHSFDPVNEFFRGAGRPTIVIFTYPVDAGFIPKNSGFATEPGEFSVFLILALMLHGSINNFKIDKIIIVLAVAVLTTMSTSGYLGLIIFIGYYWYNKKNINTKLVVAIIALPAVVLMLNLEFVYRKVENAFDHDLSIYELAYEDRISPGRFGSLMLDLNDFRENPFLGYGIHKDTRYKNFGGIEQHRSNGVSDYLVKFGIFGFIIMLYNYYKSFSLFDKIKNIRGSVFILVAVLIVTFSQIILVSPLFFLLQFYHFKIRV